MTDQIYNVLFSCTGNSARSIMAECILGREGKGRFHASDAGGDPKCQTHPFAMELLRKLDHPAGGLCSKDWEEFAVEGAPVMDLLSLRVTPPPTRFAPCGRASP